MKYHHMGLLREKKKLILEINKYNNDIIREIVFQENI